MQAATEHERMMNGKAKSCFPADNREPFCAVGSGRVTC
jgi:hypothetical protein